MSLSKKIYITDLELWDVKGFTHFEAKLGQINIVSGTNGAGKTSFVRGLEMFFESGGDPALIRCGAAEAHGRITFSNGYKAEKMVRRDGFSLKVFNPEGGTCPAPATLIENWLPRHSFDASVFLDDFDSKKRTDFVLQHLPIEFIVDEFNAALETRLGQLDLDSVSLLPPGEPLSLDKFDAAYSEIYSARTNINQKIEDLRGAEKALLPGLPQHDATDWSAEAKRIQAELTTLENALAALESSIKLEAEEARSAKLTSYRAESESLKQVTAAYLREVQNQEAAVAAFSASTEHSPADAQKILGAACALKDNCEAYLRAAKEIPLVKDNFQKQLETINRIETEAIADERQKLAEGRRKLDESLGEARERAAQQQKGAGVRETLEKTRAKLKGEATRYEHLTVILNALQKLKAEKLRAVDIEGFDIQWVKAKGARSESAVITIDGIPLNELHRAKMLFIGLKLVLLAQKANPNEEQVPLVIMETAELVDSNLAQLIDACRAAGWQLVVTVPEDEMPLAVEVA